MFRRNLMKALVGGLCATLVSSAMAQSRVSATQKGSLLIFSNVEVKWSAAGAVIQDTFIELSNDFTAPVAVQLYFVNGDAPTAQDPGWNWADNIITLTQDEPSYWAASSGLPKGVSPWSVLDPGNPPGRPDPDNPSIRTLRGFVYGWAVNAQDQQIRHNHLTGKAVIINYADSSAAEYQAYAFQALYGSQGSVVGTPGHLQLDGTYYDYGFDQLILDFYKPGSMALSGGGNIVGVDTDLTLHPIDADLRQDGTGPVTTKAKFDIWDQNETRLSGYEYCITCWDQSLLSTVRTPNHFRQMQTDKGKARIDGIPSPVVCPVLPPLTPSQYASLLGISNRLLSFNGGQAYAAAASNLVGSGTESAWIKYDVLVGPGEVVGGNAALQILPSAVPTESAPASPKVKAKK